MSKKLNLDELNVKSYVIHTDKTGGSIKGGTGSGPPPTVVMDECCTHCGGCEFD